MHTTRLIGFGAALLISTGPLLAGCDQWSGDRTAQTTYSGAPVGTTRTLASMRAGDMVGRSVYTRTGDRIGEVDDVVVNRNNRATGVVLGVGGFLGVGEKKAVVPLNQLEMQGDRLVAPNLTRDDLQRMSAYQDRDWDRYDRSRTLGEITR